jgi:predicted  nucleic acid-binding Zn-ribbon protein
MSGDQGFVDLRLNQQEGQVNESFWPSFTDIMTVVVMIFLIAMVVLLMRNMELVAELRATMEAERAASELARAQGVEKETLAYQLHAAQDRISALQLQLMRLQESNLAQESTISRQRETLAAVTAERDDFARQAAALTLDRQRLETELESRRLDLDRARQTIAGLEANIGGLEQNLASLQERFADTQSRMGELQQALARQQQEMEAARVARQEAERRYLVLTGEYDDLRVKYDKLVKPARSPTGRRLVEVRYWKDNGDYRIAYRPDGSGAFRDIGRAALNARLAQLKDAAPNGLYIKVVFPEESGLSFNEAWEFTNHLHANYDYYHQEAPATAAPDAGEAR